MYRHCQEFFVVASARLTPPLPGTLRTGPFFEPSADSTAVVSLLLRLLSFLRSNLAMKVYWFHHWGENREREKAKTIARVMCCHSERLPTQRVPVMSFTTRRARCPLPCPCALSLVLAPLPRLVALGLVLAVHHNGALGLGLILVVMIPSLGLVLAAFHRLLAL